MSIISPYLLVPILIGNAVLTGYFFLFGKTNQGWLALAVYGVLSLGLLINADLKKGYASLISKNTVLATLHYLAKIIFSWQVLALLAAVLFFIGQAYIMGAESFMKTKGVAFSATVLRGTAMCLIGLILAAPYVLGKKGTIRVSFDIGQWLMVGIFTVGFAWWAQHFLFQVSFEFAGGKRMYSLFDDAMISLRYAWNLVEGHGLVWNIGERVEGFTNLFMVLYMSIGTFFFDKNGAVLFTHISGILFIFGIAVCLMGISRTVFRDVLEEKKWIYQGLAFLLPFLYYPLLYWSIMGMETGILALLATGAAWIAIRPVEKARFNPWFSLLCSCMVLTRPDAVIQVSLIFLFRWFTLWRHQGAFPTVFAEGLLFLILPIAQLLFRHSYYGEWLPNTYILKMTGLTVAERIANGKGFVSIFLHSIWPALIVGVLGTVWPWRKEKVLMLLLLLSAMSYQVYVGGDPWPYWRIMAPYVPMLMLLNLAGWDSIFSLLTRWYRPERPVFNRSGGVVWIVVTLLLITFAWINIKFLPEMFFQTRPYAVTYNGAHVRIGLNLKEVCTPEATIGTLWSGTIPYYSGLKNIDFLGKCDKIIARLEPDRFQSGNGMKSVPGHNKYDLKYSIRELKPDYIQNYFWAGNDEREYVHKHYVMKNNMWFKKDSPNIHWDKLPK